MTGNQYGTIGLLGIGFSFLALLALHILDSDLSVVDRYISEYALGDYGWLSRAADFALGAGMIAIALGLKETLASGKRVAASWVLVLIAGLGFFVAGLFETDPTGTFETTARGAIHDIAGYVTVLSLVIASWILRGVFARDSRSTNLARTQLWFAIVISVTLMAVLVLSEVSVGLPQRTFVAAVMAWLAYLAINLRRAGEPAHAT